MITREKGRNIENIIYSLVESLDNPEFMNGDSDNYGLVDIDDQTGFTEAFTELMDHLGLEIGFKREFIVHRAGWYKE